MKLKKLSKEFHEWIWMYCNAMDTKEFSFSELKNVKIFSDFKRWKKIPYRRDFYSYEKQVYKIKFLQDCLQ